MGIETGTALIIAAVVSAGAAVASSQASAAAQRRTAAQQAKLAKESAEYEAAANKANAAQESSSAAILEKKMDIERRNQERVHRIQQADRLASAAASGLTVPGTSLGRLLEQQQQEDDAAESALGFEWHQAINEKLDRATLFMSQAKSASELGGLRAGIITSIGNTEANATATTGFISAGAALGKGAAQASAEDW